MNVPCTHAPCIQGDDFFFNAGYIPLIFGNELRFKLTVAVSGNIHLEFAILAFRGFREVSNPPAPTSRTLFPALAKPMPKLTVAVVFGFPHICIFQATFEPVPFYLYVMLLLSKQSFSYLTVKS